MGYVEGANASNLQCLEYLSQDKCLSSLHKGLCSNPCVQVSVYKGSQWALFVATVAKSPLGTDQFNALYSLVFYGIPLSI